MDFGNWSRPVITVAPVVVRPETDSNSESVNDISGKDASRNGMAPISPSPAQNNTTTMKPSAQAQFLVDVAHRQPQEGADAEYQHEAQHECLDRLVFIPQRNAQRRQHGDAEQHQQQPEDFLDDEELHRNYRNVILTWNSLSTSGTRFLSPTSRMTWSSDAMTVS